MFNIALEVFNEMKLIELLRGEEPDSVSLSLVPTSAKVDLNDSVFLRNVKAMSEETNVCQ